jgi:ABC-type arginine transport system ATPase subunit
LGRIGNNNFGFLKSHFIDEIRVFKGLWLWCGFISLQYCLWDHFKQLNSMETRQIMNLAYLLADLVAKFVVSLAVLKVVEFSDMWAMTLKGLGFRLAYSE